MCGFALCFAQRRRRRFWVRYTQTMQVTIDVPDELAAALTFEAGDPARTALEAMALEAYRERRITAYQLRSVLGIPSRLELDRLLKDRRIESYTAEDFEHDLAGLDAPAPVTLRA